MPGTLNALQEEALLKSDEEIDAAKKMKVQQHIEGLASDEDSSMPEVVHMEEYSSSAGVNESNSADGNEDGGDHDDDDNSEDNDDDDDDDDDDEMDEANKVLSEYKEILKDLKKQQYSYDKYLRLCDLSHKTGDLDYIRNAYNLFSTVYPLAPELWLKYLSIEASVALSTKEIEATVVLFRRALSDYYSTEVAEQFAALAIKTKEGNDIWNEVLYTYGLHCMKGQRFFKQYRQYLAAHTTMSSEEKEIAYIESYLQELKYPLYNMEESYIEFKVFYEKHKAQIKEINWDLLDRNYFKAKDHLHKILPYEEKLKELEKNAYRERAELYMNYIKDSDKFLDENIIQTIYERMITDCCLDANCWLIYIDFIDYRDEYGRPEDLQNYPIFQQTPIDINNRALRNCTWSEKLYIRRIQLLEKMEKSREEIQEVLESSLSAGFQTAEPVVAIWLEYLAYLRRNTDWESEAECEILRKNFNLCWTILGQQWGVLADCNCEILQFWGRLEYGPLQDAKRGRDLWTTVMGSSDNATKSGLWIEFIQLEMRRDLDSTRKLFRKALETPDLDNPLVIIAAWQRFERCNGTLKTLRACTKECEQFVQQMTATTTTAHPANSAQTVKNKQTLEKGGIKRKTLPTSATVVPDKKLKQAKMGREESLNLTKREESGGGARETEVAFKEHENQEIDLTKDHLRIFLSNLDYNLTEDELRSSLPELKIVKINLIRSANGKSRGFGYLELESVDDVEKALSLDRRNLNGRPVFISSVLRDKEKRQIFKYSDGLEPKKLFIKSLSHDTTKEDLEKIYSAFGNLKDVRLVYHKSGKFKNIAYVEYEDERAASKAIMGTDQMELRGHTISVAISAPPPKAADLSSNPTKLFGMGKKRSKTATAFDQKPRMSFIPTAVRKKFSAPLSASTVDASTPLPQMQCEETGARKTNEDFRKLLQKS